MAMSPKAYKGIDNEEDLKWEELRSLFIGDERAFLHEMQSFIEDKDKFAREIGKSLPQALRVSMFKNEELSKQLIESMRPVLEQALAESARLNTESLSSKLQPIFGPAIRRSINDTFKRMDQSFSNMFLKTLSFRGLQYRIEAWRSGRPFAHVLISKTMNYKVKEVFLIHFETGLLLKHVAIDSQTQDADMMSAMLKAIQDFVTDSFNTDVGNSQIGSIEFGDQRIYLEQGSKVVLAAVVYGSLPEHVDKKFEDARLVIENDYDEFLHDFDGDPDHFESTEPILRKCFEEGKDEISHRMVMTPYILLFFLLMVLGIFSYPIILDNYRWSNYLEEISKIDGVIVVEEDKKNGKFVVVGMRKPASENPDKLISKFELDPNNVDSHWIYYSPHSPDAVQKKAERVLRKPPTVEFKLDGETLFVKGSATHIWHKWAKSKMQDIWEVNNFNTDSLTIVEVEDPKKSAKRIEQKHVLFHLESSSLTVDEMDNAAELVREIQNLINTAAYYNQKINVVVSGYTDGTGDLTFNRKLSKERAKTVYNYLVSNGVSESLLSYEGHGFDKEQSETELKVSQQSLRKVKITIILKGN